MTFTFFCLTGFGFYLGLYVEAVRQTDTAIERNDIARVHSAVHELTQTLISTNYEHRFALREFERKMLAKPDANDH